MPGLPAVLGDRPHPVQGCVQAAPPPEPLSSPAAPARVLAAITSQEVASHRGTKPDPLSFYEPEDSFLKTQTLTLGLKTL